MKTSILFMAFVFFLTGCGGDKSPLKFSISGSEGSVVPVKVEPTKKDPAWESLKKNLLEASCTKCHNPDTAQRKKRLDLTQKNLVLENYDDIIFRMTDAFDQGFDYMPPKGAKVSPEVIEEFKKWRESEIKK